MAKFRAVAPQDRQSLFYGHAARTKNWNNARQRHPVRAWLLLLLAAAAAARSRFAACATEMPIILRLFDEDVSAEGSLQLTFENGNSRVGQCLDLPRAIGKPANVRPIGMPGRTRSPGRADRLPCTACMAMNKREVWFGSTSYTPPTAVFKLTCVEYRP